MKSVVKGYAFVLGKTKVRHRAKYYTNKFVSKGCLFILDVVEYSFVKGHAALNMRNVHILKSAIGEIRACKGLSYYV